MAEVVTKVIMNNGEKFTLHQDPAEVIEKFTDENGKILDKFIEMGVLYINPKHVSMLIYEENKEDEIKEAWGLK